MKSIYILFFSMFIANSYGQVGSGTTLPLGSFHVDAKKDNSPAINPTPEQISNDLIVDEKGQVGLGTLKPQVKLDAKGDLQVQDGVLKIGSTPTLTTDDVKMVVIDKQGVVGAKKIETTKEASVATLRTKSTSDVNYGTDFTNKYNDAIFVSVPFKATDLLVNLGNMISAPNNTTGGDIDVLQDGYYQLSATLNIVLRGSGSNGQKGTTYFKAQLLRYNSKESKWELITGIRSIFYAVGGSNIHFPHTFPTSIAQLNKGDKIRIQYARSANGSTPQGNPVNTAYLGYNSSLNLYPYQLFISKL